MDALREKQRDFDREADMAAELLLQYEASTNLSATALVKEALAQREVAFLIEASDGTENGREKVLSRAGDLPVVTCFTRAELGAAVGRTQAVHLAVFPGKLGEHFMADARRYAGIIGFNHPQTGGER